MGRQARAQAPPRSTSVAKRGDRPKLQQLDDEAVGAGLVRRDVGEEVETR